MKSAARIMFFLALAALTVACGREAAKLKLGYAIVEPEGALQAKFEAWLPEKAGGPLDFSEGAEAPDKAEKNASPNMESRLAELEKARFQDMAAKGQGLIEEIQLSRARKTMLLKAEKVAEDIARRLEEQDSRLQSRLDDVFTASYLRQQLALDIERPSKFDWLSQEARLALLKINARLTARSFPEMQESERLRIMNINMKLAAGRLSEREKASLQMDKSEMLGKYASRRLMRQESEIGRFESETRSALTEARMIRQDIRTDGRKKLVEELSAVDNTRIVETLVESRANASMEAGRDRIRTEIRWRWDRLAESAARPAAEVPEENDAAPKTEAKSRFYEIRLRNRMTKAGDEGGYGLILKNPLYVSRAFEKMDEEKMDEGASD